jgi:integrase
MCYQSAPSIQKDISHCIALYESILSDNPNDNQNKELFTRTILDPFKNALSGYIKDNSNEFVFPYLNSKDFTKGLIISKNLDENQTRLLHNARKVYNDHLNKLAEMAEIDIKLTSHVWRHTHAMQMVSNQSFSLTDISATLGHSTERTTRIYISQFPQARMAEISKRISTDNPIY